MPQPTITLLWYRLTSADEEETDRANRPNPAVRRCATGRSESQLEVGYPGPGDDRKSWRDPKYSAESVLAERAGAFFQPHEALFMIFELDFNTVQAFDDLIEPADHFRP